MIATICRTFHFNAAHRLHNSHWPDERNKEVFGKCNNPNYHGHNYELIVKVRGEVDPETGYIIDTKILKEWVENDVIQLFDHRNLNLDVAAFAELNPTVENIATVIYTILQPRMQAGKKLSIVLYETERNYVEYSGE